MKNKNIYIASIFTAFSLFACTEAPKTDNTENEVTTEDTLSTVAVEEEEEVNFVLPSPIQIAAIFNRSGLKYNGELPNKADQVSNYNTKTSKFLNFGVYSADLAYSVLNDKQQESINYLNSIKKLSDDIGMESIFGTGNLTKRFEKNISNQDTVLSILTEIKIKTDNYLEENKEQSKSAIFFAGAWVEGMYLGSKSYSENSKVNERIIEQMNLLQGLIPALKAQKDETFDLDQLITQLEEVNYMFNNFEEVKSYNENEKALQLTSESMKALGSKIESIRNSIV